MKPLFIPLKTEYFEAFERGEKDEELREYGPCWNEKTCVVGRPVTLSKGYGKRNRLKGAVIGFRKVSARDLSDIQKSDVFRVYGTYDILIAAIKIEVFPDEADDYRRSGETW